MELTCPACGKTNEVTAPAPCVRCGCDLGPLARTIVGSDWHLDAALKELQVQNWEAALQQAEKSWSLRHSARSARLAFLAAMSLSRGEDAVNWMRRAHRCSRQQ